MSPGSMAGWVENTFVYRQAWELRTSPWSPGLGVHQKSLPRSKSAQPVCVFVDYKHASLHKCVRECNNAHDGARPGKTDIGNSMPASAILSPHAGERMHLSFETTSCLSVHAVCGSCTVCQIAALILPAAAVSWRSPQNHALLCRPIQSLQPSALLVI